LDGYVHIKRANLLTLSKAGTKLRDFERIGIGSLRIQVIERLFLFWFDFQNSEKVKLENNKQYLFK
jgi:hypothetical protein